MKDWGPLDPVSPLNRPVDVLEGSVNHPENPIYESQGETRPSALRYPHHRSSQKPNMASGTRRQKACPVALRIKTSGIVGKKTSFPLAPFIDDLYGICCLTSK